MTKNLPPEPGTVSDTSLGIQGDFPDAPENEPEEPTRINDDEEVEDA